MIAAALLFALSSSPSHLESALEASRRVRVAEPGIVADGRADGIGSLTLRVERGVAYPLEDGAGRTVGVFVQGTGTWSFRAADRTARETLLASREDQHWRLDLDEGVVSSDFRDAVVLFTRPELATLLAPGTPTSAPPDEGAFRRMWDRLDRFELAWDQRLAVAGLDPTAGPFAAASISRDDPVGWIFDGEREFREELFFPVGRPGAWFFRSLLVSQPVGGGKTAQTPPLAVEGTTVDVVQTDAHRGRTASRFDVEVEEDGVRIARFALASVDQLERFRLLRPKDRKAGVVESVADGSGASLPFVHGWDTLLVDLGPGRKKGETLRITVVVGRDVPNGFVRPEVKGVASTFPAGGFLVPVLENGAPWRPVPVAYSAELPEGVRLVPPAPEVAPARASFALGRDFETHDIEAAGIAIRLLVPNATPPAYVERALSRSREYVSWLAASLGPAPFRELTVSAVPEVAPGGAVHLSPQGLAAGDDCPYRTADAGGALAFGIARRWLAARSHPLDARSGAAQLVLASYVADLAIDASRSPDTGVCLDRRRGDWRVATRSCAVAPPVEAMLELSSRGSSGCYGGGRGSLAVDDLRLSLGDGTFLAALSDALSGASDRPVDFEALEASARKIDPGRDAGLFDEAFRTHRGIFDPTTATPASPSPPR